MGMEFPSCSPYQSGITCVENCWFYEVIIQGERIMNYQFARPIEIRAIRIIRMGLDLPDNIMLQKSGLKF